MRLGTATQEGRKGREGLFSLRKAGKLHMWSQCSVETKLRVQPALPTSLVGGFPVQSTTLDLLLEPIMVSTLCHLQVLTCRAWAMGCAGQALTLKPSNLGLFLLPSPSSPPPPTVPPPRQADIKMGVPLPHCPLVPPLPACGSSLGVDVGCLLSLPLLGLGR